jgi:CDP-diacylglycerol--serine O-phosphatidyltransferase
VAAGLLMVSRIKYFSFKGFPKGGRVPFFVMALVVVTIAVLFIAQAKGLFAIALVYVASGPAWWLWTKVRRKHAA